MDNMIQESKRRDAAGTGDRRDQRTGGSEMRADTTGTRGVVTTTTLRQILADLGSLGLESEERIEMALDLVRSGHVRLTGRAAYSVYQQLRLPQAVN